MIPKSEKLSREETESETVSNVIDLTEILQTQSEGPIQVRVVDCCNDFVAVLQTQVQSSIELTDDIKYKNEGLVIGVGPGTSDGSGGRLKPCVEIGDYVMFGEKNVIQKVESNSPPYHGQLVVILSERNVICKLPTEVDWVEYKGE